jgi:HSP20 family protein
MTHKDTDIADDQSYSLGGESMFSAHGDWYMMRRRRLWRPPTDVYETDEHVVVKIEIAGVSSDDFKITFADHRLIIAGQRRDPVGKLIYQNMEIRYGEFRSEVWIGWALDQAAIEASYEDGFLFVKLPRATEHHIQVQVRNGNEI